ncbi:MAG: hypothetical protein KTR15_09405 [Phycisphaeraceae bacterium]|nr:hypothetical protein [Phycisphaeraceae bacterium]
MTINSKSSIAQIPKLMLYKRPLHPELFSFKARRVDRHGDYEVETWLVNGGHVVRFVLDGQSLVEAVLEGNDHLPESNLAHALPCLGEKEYEFEGEGNVAYFTTLQTESLTENLYLATFREMRDFATEVGALQFEQETPAGPNLYVLDCQKYKNEFHVQGYHLTAGNGNVLRTQSVFEIQQ